KPDKSRQRVRTMFGEISRRYDFLNHFLSAGTDYYWRWRAVRKVPVQPHVPILDVCTGTGDLALAFRKRAHPSVRIVGTDFTRQMLAIAESKKQGAGRTRDAPPPDFLEADTLQMPFSDNSFQIVAVSFGLRNLSDTGAGLGEMIRVCRPGGHVLVLEFSLPGNRWLRGLYL
ncbi:MAG: ubiquinone/menaquinone biosynthesis methyltransferase, partial [Planctomycetaceae bacterium]